jgi:hypothetical protein
MGDIIIEETNYKALLYLLFNLLTLFAAISITVYGFQSERVSLWLTGICTGIALSIGLIGSIVRVLKVKKLITITRDGIIDNSSIGGVGYISYDDISEFRIVTIYNKKAIAVFPKNIDNFMSQLSTVKRRFVKRNLNLNLPPVAIYVNRAKDMEPEDILSLLQKRLADIISLDD